MTTRAVLQGSGRHRIGAVTIALLAAVALTLLAAAPAGAAKLVGRDGKVYACYQAKGKTKGTVRLVRKKQHCRHGEKKISWNVAGKSGRAGQDGESGTPGGSGEPGGPGASGLEQRVATLAGKVTALEGVLAGVTNTDLLSALGKLQGVSGAQLQEAVAGIANVKALCAQATVLTTQVDSLGKALGGASLLGSVKGVLELVVTGVPAPLPGFGCS